MWQRQMKNFYYSSLLQFPYDPTYGEKESSSATDKLIRQVNCRLIGCVSVFTGQKEPKPLHFAFLGTKK